MVETMVCWYLRGQGVLGAGFRPSTVFIAIYLKGDDMGDAHHNYHQVRIAHPNPTSLGDIILPMDKGTCFAGHLSLFAREELRMSPLFWGGEEVRREES